ncbi:RNA polymerase sigma factor [Bacteroidota bacterium]
MDASEFKKKVLPVSQKIYRYAGRLLGNVHDAEDVVQEIWVKLWERRDQLDEVKNIQAFAFRMTRNLCLDKIKLKKPQYYDDREEAAYRFDEADGEPDPERKLELKDTVEKVNHIIGSLPEQQQTLVQLRDVEGLEYDEISHITGLEVNAIRVNISRARKKIRETLYKKHQV